MKISVVYFTQQKNIPIQAIQISFEKWGKSRFSDV